MGICRCCAGDAVSVARMGWATDDMLSAGGGVIVDAGALLVVSASEMSEREGVAVGCGCLHEKVEWVVTRAFSRAKLTRRDARSDRWRGKR